MEISGRRPAIYLLEEFCCLLKGERTKTATAEEEGPMVHLVELLQYLSEGEHVQGAAEYRKTERIQILEDLTKTRCKSYTKQDSMNPPPPPTPSRPQTWLRNSALAWHVHVLHA